MLTARRAAGLLLLVGVVGCPRIVQKVSKAREVPSGDAIWLEETVGSEDADVEKQIVHSGFTAAFLPAVRMARGPEGWAATEVAPPPRPFDRTAVFLTVTGGPEISQAAAPADPNAAAPFAVRVLAALEAPLKTRALYGSRIAGIHLDFPFAADAAASYGEFLKALRAKLPPGLLLTVSLHFAPEEADRPKFVEALAAADGFVVFVFGEAATASPVAADEIGKPWWAAYSPGATGTWKDAYGEAKGPLAEKHLLALVDDPRLELTNELPFKEEAASGFLITARQPVQAAGTKFGAGDRLSFRQPSLAEMLYRFGADLAGRRRVRGRIVVMPGSSDKERLFTLGALEDVLLGHPLDPDVRVSVTGARSPVITVEAHNANTHASVISRSLNWVEVDMPEGGLRDVQPGGFDRFEVYDAQGKMVTPGRATRVRFFETLVAPFEAIEPARILLQRPASAECCRFRQSIVSSAGPEVKTDWTAPPPPPTPVPKPKAAPKKRGHSAAAFASRTAAESL